MKARLVLLFLLAITTMAASAQEPAMELTFTAIDSAAWVQLDSIKVMNRTQGGDTVLVYPDTVLVLGWVGLPESQDASEGLSVQVYPNPVTDHSTITVWIPEEDIIKIFITDLLGRQVIAWEQQLAGGIHRFSFTPGGEDLYLFSIEWKGITRSDKMIKLSKKSGNTCSLYYLGFDSISKPEKALNAVSSFEFTPGDLLLLIGYSDTLQSGMLEAPETSENYTFQFATNIPCPGTPTVTYEGQVYNTIQIFSQCWLKENLNVGAMILSSESMTDDGVIEKYCYNNEPDSCSKYGGLYQWWEMMQYTTQPGVQGICPPDWYIPTDEEWKVLEGAVDSQYGIGDAEWDFDSGRGYDAGTNIRTTNYWQYAGTDLYGFSALPNGYRHSDSLFYYNGDFGYWWTSNANGTGKAWGRVLTSWPEVLRIGSYYKEFGYSIRCVLDY
jgi:uncharacterized protein (TIGR02145 family)